LQNFQRHRADVGAVAGDILSTEQADKGVVARMIFGTERGAERGLESRRRPVTGGNRRKDVLTEAIISWLKKNNSL
jgi:hypothetical protein